MLNAMYNKHRGGLNITLSVFLKKNVSENKVI